MGEQVAQLCVAQLTQCELGILAAQRREPDDSALAIRTGTPGKDQAKLILDVLGDATTGLHLPLLAAYFDYPTRHVRVPPPPITPRRPGDSSRVPAVCLPDAFRLRSCRPRRGGALDCGSRCIRETHRHDRAVETATDAAHVPRTT